MQSHNLIESKLPPQGREWDRFTQPFVLEIMGIHAIAFADWLKNNRNEKLTISELYELFNN